MLYFNLVENFLFFCVTSFRLLHRHSLLIWNTHPKTLLRQVAHSNTCNRISIELRVSAGVSFLCPRLCWWRCLSSMTCSFRGPPLVWPLSRSQHDSLELPAIRFTITSYSLAWGGTHGSPHSVLAKGKSGCSRLVAPHHGEIAVSRELLSALRRQEAWQKWTPPLLLGAFRKFVREYIYWKALCALHCVANFRVKVLQSPL